jgi:hypothetical protein
MRMIVITVSTLLGLLFLCVPVLSQALGEDRYNDKIKKYKYRYNDLTVIGEPV